MQFENCIGAIVHLTEKTLKSNWKKIVVIRIHENRKGAVFCKIASFWYKLPAFAINCTMRFCKRQLQFRLEQ